VGRGRRAEATLARPCSISRWIARVKDTARAHTAWNSPREREEALAQIARARPEMARRGGQ
jgi:hypothetical protein